MLGIDTREWTRDSARATLASLILNSSGHTVWFGGHYWKVGYVIGDNRTSVKIKSEDTDLHPYTIVKLVDWVHESSSICDGIGIWTDPDTGIIYLDRVTHVLNKDTALELGHRRGELCIWDLKNLEALDCFSYA